MSLIYFVLVAFGLTSILTQSKLFEKIRPKHYFFHCPQCVGFWVGAFLCSINQFTTLFSFDVSVFNFFLLGWLSSGTSYILNMVFGDNGVKHEHKHVDKQVDASAS